MPQMPKLRDKSRRQQKKDMDAQQMDAGKKRARLNKANAQSAREKSSLSKIAKSRKKMSVVTGVAFGIAAASLAFGGMALSTAAAIDARNNADSVEVVVTTQDVDPGSVVDESILTTEKVPKTWVPANAIMPDDVDNLVGHVTITGITANQPIQSSSIQDWYVPSALSSAMEDGHVAYTLGIDASSGMAYMLHVGDYVKILGLGDEFNHVRVIALDGTLSGNTGDNGYSTITFDLTVDQANTLFAAQNDEIPMRLVLWQTEYSGANVETDIKVDNDSGTVPDSKQSDTADADDGGTSGTDDAEASDAAEGSDGSADADKSSLDGTLSSVM